jgi:GAF domain-containing protein
MVANSETTPPRAVPSFGKPKLSLLTVFDRQRRQSLIWFLLAMAAWVWSAWDRHQLVEQLTRKREVLMIDSLGTYYVSPVVGIQQAKDLHAMQTKLACKALFERNPEGLDNPELFKQLFLREAAQTAQAALNKTKAEFEAKSLHQKVEVGLPEILSTRDDAFYTSADIQLIRVGAYQGAPITEVLHYRVKFKFLVNPDLTRNGRFPTAVAAFQVEPVNKT